MNPFLFAWALHLRSSAGTQVEHQTNPANHPEMYDFQSSLILIGFIALCQNSLEANQIEKDGANPHELDITPLKSPLKPSLSMALIPQCIQVLYILG
jgi:hypothetical protein